MRIVGTSKSLLSEVLTGWDDAITLAFPVWHLSLVVNDDVTGFSNSLRTNDSLHGDDFADEGLLGLEKLHGDVLLFPVRIGFKVVLSLGGCLRESGASYTEDHVHVITSSLFSITEICRDVNGIAVS